MTHHRARARRQAAEAKAGYGQYVKLYSRGPWASAASAAAAKLK